MNTLEYYSRERAQQQITAGSLKSKILVPGTVLIVKDLKLDDFKQGNRTVPNDTLFCVEKDSNKNIKVPVRELFKMTVENNDGSHYYEDETGTGIKFPNEIKIVSSSDRMTAGDDPQPVYPVYAYELAQQFFESDGKMKWGELVAGGLKADNTMDIVQNYVVEVS